MDDVVRTSLKRKTKYVSLIFFFFFERKTKDPSWHVDSWASLSEQTQLGSTL